MRTKMLHEGYFKDGDDAESQRMQLELVNYYFSAEAWVLIWKGGGMWKLGTSLDLFKTPNVLLLFKLQFPIVIAST